MTDPMVPTPPVVDAGLPDAAQGGWDGTERRRADALSLAIKSAVGKVAQNSAPQVQTSFVTTVVSIGAILALQCLILVSQFRLADRQADAATTQQHFRESIVCYLVEVTRAQEDAARAGQVAVGVGTRVLTTCGFVTTPGNQGKK